MLLTRPESGTQIQGIDATLQQTMQVDGPALLQSMADQIDAARRNFRQAIATAALKAEERVALQQSVQDITAQVASLQQQLGAVSANQQAEQQRLQH